MASINLRKWVLVTRKDYDRLIIQRDVLCYIGDVLDHMVFDTVGIGKMSREFHSQLQETIQEAITGEISKVGLMGAEAGKRWREELLRKRGL